MSPELYSRKGAKFLRSGPEMALLHLATGRYVGHGDGVKLSGDSSQMQRAPWRLRTICVALGGIALAGGWLVIGSNSRNVVDVARASDVSEGISPSESGTPPLTTPQERKFIVAEKLMERLNRIRAAQETRPNEAIISFHDAAAMSRFVNQAGGKGFRVVGRIDRFNALRIAIDSYDDFAAQIGDYASDIADLGGNILFRPPDLPPEPENRVAGTQIPIGNNLLEFLGVTEANTAWGRGVTIAILDSGVVPDPTLAGRVRFLDGGYGLAPLFNDGHGTAVASLAAGMLPDAPGVAPDASILSIRVTGPEGVSDAFTLSQAIVGAVDYGARIVNISLGSYGTSELLVRAIDYATSMGAVLVASAGNDQATQLTWPAADPRVVSVGAVDGREQQVIFSNSSEQLQISAPGYGVVSAWLNGERVLIDGTSASAPIVSGAIAAVMSQFPGLSAPQAWQIIQQRVSDAGPAGADPDYGGGILNLGWAMDWNNTSRIDPAISSHWFNATTGQMEFVVQNRSGAGVSGLQLNVNSAGIRTEYDVPWLAPGGIYVVRVSVDQGALRDDGRLEYRTRLEVPSGINDARPANNLRTSSLSRPQPQ